MNEQDIMTINIGYHMCCKFHTSTVTQDTLAPSKSLSSSSELAFLAGDATIAFLEAATGHFLEGTAALTVTSETKDR